MSAIPHIAAFMRALEQMAPERVNGDGQIRIIICRTDANQPLQPDSIQPTLPLMPSVGTEMKFQNRRNKPQKSPSRAEQVDAVKAKISRRNSLQKQRAALKS